MKLIRYTIYWGKKKLDRHIMPSFKTLLHRYLLVPCRQIVLDSIFMYSQVTAGLTLFSNVYAVIKRSKIYANLTCQSDYYDQLSAVGGMGAHNVLSNTLVLLQKPFARK